MWSVASCLAPQAPVRQPSYEPSVQASVPQPSAHMPSSPARLGRTCLLPLLLWIHASILCEMLGLLWNAIQCGLTKTGRVARRAHSQI